MSASEMKRTALALLFIGFVFAGDYLDFNNWTVHFYTIQRSDALADQNELRLQFFKALENVYYDSDLTLREYLDLNSRIQRRLERLSLPFRQVEAKFLSDGSLQIEYEVPITGPFLKTILPKTGGGIPLAPMACPLCKRPWPEGMPVPPDVSLVPLEEETPTDFTGILLDARGLKLNPALFPKIVNEEGKEVYGLSFVLPNYLQERGLVSYLKNPSDAYNSERGGMNPLRINGLRVSGDNNTDIVISNSDALKIHSSSYNFKLLERCQVGILLGD